MNLSKQVSILFLCCSLVRFTARAESLGPTGQANEQQQPPSVQDSPQGMRSHSNLKGEVLANEVDKQPRDPNVRTLTQFPSVLENMDKNVSLAAVDVISDRMYGHEQLV